MSCIGCDLKETVSQLDVHKLVEEQLELEQDLVSTKIREKRLNICCKCPSLSQHTCVHCGCFVEFRASLRQKKCPRDKW